jgi:hypothetical protein
MDKYNSILIKWLIHDIEGFILDKKFIQIKSFDIILLGRE